MEVKIASMLAPNVPSDLKDSQPVGGWSTFDREIEGRRRIKILVIIPTLWVGGQEASLVRTLLRIDRTRFEIVVCTFHDRGVLAQQLIDAGIRIVGPFPNSSGPLFLLARSAGRRLNRWLARWNPTWRAEVWLKWPIQMLASAAALVFLRSSKVE